MSSMSDRDSEEIGETREQWVASWKLIFDQEETYMLQRPTVGASENLSESDVNRLEADVNLLEADLNREIVSSIVPIEHDKGILELESLPEHAPLGVTDSSSTRPPLQPSNSEMSSLLAAALHGNGGGRKRSGTVSGRSQVRYQVRCQHSVASERHRQPINRLRSSTKPGSKQGRLNCVAGDLKGISRALDALGEDRNLVPHEKRPRSPTWSAEEKQAYLVLKVEASRVVNGKHWEFISQSLWERWEFERSSKCCEDFWYTIRKSYKAIQGHVFLKNNPQRGKWVSYWDMDEEGRSKKKLPKSFSLEWCEMIERIITAQDKRVRKKSTGSIAVQESFEREDDEEYSNQQLHMTGPAEMPWNLENAGRERFTRILKEPLVQKQVEDVVDSTLQRLGCRKRLGDTTEDDRITMLSTVVKQKVQDAIKEDELMIRLAPFFKKHIEDVLERNLRPVTSALQVQEREELEEQEFQEQLRALAEKKQALALEEDCTSQGTNWTRFSCSI